MVNYGKSEGRIADIEACRSGLMAIIEERFAMVLID